MPIPHEDVGFVAWLDGLVERGGDPGRMEPQAFQVLVRERYPAAIVHPQHPLATLDPSSTVWYVYRDGSPRTS